MTAGVFLNYMAQKGYVIFVLDNRGTRNRGRDFEKCIHRNLGVYESEDQMTGVRYLKTLPFIDTTRLGLDGWSYGGFMTLTLITEHPEVFKAASCGGPVVNWEWYEVMYGERYMDTPQENPEGYNRANILHKIEKLKCPLLVMHGAQDHTVVWQHSLELLREAVDSDVQIDYFTFPTHDHNVMGINRVNMWKKIEQFHELHLKY
jgi:dipeptidyl-peptidase-4